MATQAPPLHSWLGGQGWPAEQAPGTAGSGWGAQDPRALSQEKPSMQSASVVQRLVVMQVPLCVSQNCPWAQSSFT